MIQSEPKQDFDDYPAQFKQQLKRIFDWKTKGNTTGYRFAATTRLSG